MINEGLHRPLLHQRLVKPCKFAGDAVPQGVSKWTQPTTTPHTGAASSQTMGGVEGGGGERALHMPLTVLEVENGQDFSEQRKDSFFTLCHLFRAFILAIALKA